jgi:prolyl oligopeptidase PreP (S9A serine peptidase family)
MSFADGKKWEVKQELGEVQKNKSDVIKIRRVDFDGNEYIQLQIWHTNQDGVSVPVKDKNITFRAELKDEILKVLQK